MDVLQFLNKIAPHCVQMTDFMTRLSSAENRQTAIDLIFDIAQIFDGKAVRVYLAEIGFVTKSKWAAEVKSWNSIVKSVLTVDRRLCDKCHGRTPIQSKANTRAKHFECRVGFLDAVPPLNFQKSILDWLPTVESLRQLCCNISIHNEKLVYYEGTLRAMAKEWNRYLRHIVSSLSETVNRLCSSHVVRSNYTRTAISRNFHDSNFEAMREKALKVPNLQSSSTSPLVFAEAAQPHEQQQHLHLQQSVHEFHGAPGVETVTSTADNETRSWPSELSRADVMDFDFFDRDYTTIQQQQEQQQEQQPQQHNFLSNSKDPEQIAVRNRPKTTGTTGNAAVGLKNLTCSCAFSFLRCRLQNRYSKVVTVRCRLQSKYSKVDTAIIIPWCNKDCRRRF